MHQIGIGIPVHTAPRQLQATLDSLRAHTPPGYALLLLPDGPDAGMGAFLQSLPLPQAGTAVARGDAACFNRLVTTLDADLYVLLESGAQVGPGWLEALLAALDADPRHGLAGPSTNRAWNEQGVFPRAGSAPAQVAHTAAQAARRFGAAWQPLAPLHSLGDFCYAVRREVVRAVGAADEAYGLGPC
ncbi:MAG: hypothetical protein KC425_01945, partial [Anaerolineales bacterium]|nr:hypothetical protein [Anaerolineales bacterium]